MILRRLLNRGAWKAGIYLSVIASFFVYLPMTVTSKSTTAFAQTGVVWSADHETGNLSQWKQGTTKTPEQDSGSCSRPTNGVTTEFARSGRYSMKMTIDSMVTGSGCRQFRYPEILSGQTYYYSAWLYYPQNYKVNDYTNIFQFKSKKAGSDGSDPIWIVRTANRSNGNMYYTLRWKGGSYGLTGPQSGNGTADKTYSQALMDIPVGKWTHLEVYFRQSASFTGRITVWQDGVQLFDVDNVKTRYSDGDNRWSVNNYAYNLSPNPVVLYVDDAAVSTSRLGTGASAPAPSPTAAPTNTPTKAPTQAPTATAVPTQAPTATSAPTQAPTATAAPISPPSSSSSTLRINFMPSGVPEASGYLVDSGAPYGDRGNGYTYGWTSNNSGSARDRNSSLSANQAYDTLLHMQQDGSFTWQIALPKGSYKVRIVSGDADFFDSDFKIAAEKILLVNGTPTSSNRWVEGTATLRVNDGKLTISSASGASNNKINFIEITKQ